MQQYRPFGLLDAGYEDNNPRRALMLGGGGASGPTSAGADVVGQLAYSLTNVGGMQDAAGLLGGPSIAQNWREGNKGTAALQGVGALPVVGGAAKLAMAFIPKAGKSAAKMAKAAALPMDEASRMSRAAEQGFDTNRVMYHATPYSFDEFEPSKWRQASFFADNPDAAVKGAGAGGMEHPALGGPAGSGERVGMNIMPVLLKGKTWGIDPLPAEWFPERMTYGEYRDMLDGKSPLRLEGFTDEQNRTANYVRNKHLSASYDEAVPEAEWHKYAGENERAMPLKRNSVPVAEGYGYEDVEGPRAEYLRDMLKRLGYTNWVVNDEAGKSVAVSDPANIRSKFAAFDPSKFGSKNILAGLLGLLGGGAAMGAGSQSPNAQQGAPLL